MSAAVPPPSTVADVVIIGAGPVGLIAVFECGMLKMQCHVVDTFDAIGGQCTALYPEKPIYDIPGFPRIGAGELVENLALQAAPFRPTYHLGETVRALLRSRRPDRGRASGRLPTVARAVIIAAGGGALGEPAAARHRGYEGRRHRRVGSVEALRGRRIVVAGGGDSRSTGRCPVDIASRVMQSIGAPSSRRAGVRRSSMPPPGSKVSLTRALHGRKATARPRRGASPTTPARSGSTPLTLSGFRHRHRARSRSPTGMHIDQQIAIDPATSETSRPGIYAVGDITIYPGKLKLILTGFAETAAAAHAIYKRLNPGKVLHFEHSTTAGVPPHEPVGSERAIAALPA